MADGYCKFCSEPLPKIALNLSNKVAISKGYCSWICLSLHLGNEKALAIVRQERLLGNGRDK